MQFCSPCGILLPKTQNPEVECDCCGVVSKSSYPSSLRLAHVTKELSRPRHFDRHRQRLHGEGSCRSVQNAMVQHAEKISSLDTWCTIAEECTNLKCDAQEVRYTALQLRSADEGTTSFHYCEKCDHR
ncbi:hypothetical protein EDB82DRAFT_429077 [Fusarium venenatum]|uniref:uncharacterized protein n=1 Tax=Fusarium venenatum TaxID=56646 RepID=UPI001E067228|nr:hypothetical protein EDB82DRAFT_429077 [Fusarium venenatum]